MAIVSATKAFSVFNFNFSNLFNGVKYAGNDALFVETYSSGSADRYTGVNFKFDSDGVLKAGTVTGYSFVSAGEKPYVMKDLNYSAKAMYEAGLTKSRDDDDALIAVIFKGRDTINGSAFDDRLDGFAGEDVLNGNKGKDALYGGSGDDKLRGGAGSDVFKFFSNSDNDRIYDFDAKGQDHDIINLEFRPEIKNFDDLMENHIVKHNGFLIIKLDGGDSIRMDGVSLSALDKSDFEFG